MSLFSKLKKVEHLSPRLKNLYLHKVTRDVGMSLVGMFGPIFLYIISHDLKVVLFYHGLICLFYFLLAPLWARLLKFFSMHILMAIGQVFLIFDFAALYFLAEAGRIVWPLVALSIGCSIFYRLFYWVPYHVDFAHFVSRHHRGRQLSLLAIFVSLMGIVLPILSAFLIIKFGFPALFLVSALIVSLSFFPLFFIPHVKENYTFGFFESFKKLLAQQHFKSNLAYAADGFQDYLGGIIWPIFIFEILKGKYFEVGLVSAAIILVSCFLRYSIGEAVDRFDKNKIMKTGSLFYSLGWLLKALVTSGWHIFFVGVYHDFTSVIMRTPFDVLMYEIAADEGHYVDEFTILREMALNVGRILMIVLAFVLVIQGVSIVWLFGLGAIVSLLINLVSKEEFIVRR